jgi:hypothetical protein
MAEKSNSLLELGYTIEPGKGEKDKAGQEVVAVVYKPFFIKRTKRGKLKAFRTMDGTVESSVDGLYQLQQSGNDFTGKRPVAPAAKAA